MIKLTHLFEKNALFNQQNDTLLLVELMGNKQSNIKIERQKLNVCISIDISGSMDLSVKGNGGFNQYMNHQQSPWLNALGGNHLGQPEVPHVHQQSKLQQAKKAAVAAVSKMQDNDIISIVVFADIAELKVPATVINDFTKKEIINKINALNTRGNTNLHAGWLTAATEVAKNLSSNSINRVILLTDGQANSGERNIDVVSTHVSNLFSKSITTTTFGIGENFNEDLLEKMSNAGGGNFYYIESDEQLTDMFEEEFTGLSNIAASEVKIQLDLKNASLVEMMNDFPINNGQYVISNIKNGGKVSLLMKLNLHLLNSLNGASLGSVYVNYKDEQGIANKLELSLNTIIVDQATYNALPANQEVKIQEALLTIAKHKREAIVALDKGDVNLANNFLNGSINYLEKSGLKDNRLLKETDTLNQTLVANMNGSVNSFRKDLSYQSYKTRYSKE